MNLHRVHLQHAACRRGCAHRSLVLLHERGPDAPEDAEDEERLDDLGVRQPWVVGQEEGVQEGAELRSVRKERE